jgi:hypothetical protein
VSVVIVMSRPTDWARAIGVVAKVTSMGAVATGFAIGMSTLHYAAPSLDAASISHDRFATDLCTDNQNSRLRKTLSRQTSRRSSPRIKPPGRSSWPTRPISWPNTRDTTRATSSASRHRIAKRPPAETGGRFVWSRAPCVGEDLSVSDSPLLGRCAAPKPPASPRAIGKCSGELTPMDKALAAKITTRCVWCPPGSGERAHCRRPLTHTQFKTKDGVGTKSRDPA